MTAALLAGVAGLALLDALTQELGIPLWAFFGGAGTELDTDMTITAGDARQAAICGALRS